MSRTEIRTVVLHQRGGGVSLNAIRMIPILSLMFIHCRSTWLVVCLGMLVLPLASEGGVLEKDCGNKDYSDRFVPPRDQGNAGFCYSFAASDLLAEAIDLSPPNTISAFHLASHYVSMSPNEVESANRRISFEIARPPSIPSQMSAGANGKGGMSGIGDPSGFGSSHSFLWRTHNPSGKPLLLREGGQTDLIAAHMLNQGKLCLERDVPSQMMLRSEKDKEQQNFFAMQMAKMAGGDEWARGKQKKDEVSLAACLDQELLGLRVKKDVQRLHSAIQNWAAVRLRREADEKCKHPIDLKERLVIHSKRYNFGGMMMPQRDDETSESDIKRLLDNGRPFALHYNPCILTHCTSEEVAKSWHGSMVVGRRWNTAKNRCELKIKNSWGASCAGALPSVECQNGYWWVDQQEVVSRPHEIIWIGKK